VARVASSGDMRRGEMFVPIHWNDRTASDARVGALVAPVVDPLSGEPAFKQTPANVELFSVCWQGFVMSRAPVDLSGADWWVRVQGAGHARFELAGRQMPPDWTAALRHWLGVPDDADWIEAADPEAGIHRAAWLVEDRLQGCIFLSPRADLPARDWLSGLFADRPLTAAERAAVLAGAPLQGGDAGPTVCACFRVGQHTLVKAIQGGCHTPQAVTAKLRAGGNCGSCLPEIRALIAELRPVAAA
jgi:assimilatory nitrate reductase catalytic subunit